MFRTKIQIPESPVKITHQDTILTLGSCFSENIGMKLQESAFSVEVNPFGVLYNPMSVRNSLEDLLNERRFNKDDLIEEQGLWHSFSHSGLFSCLSPDETLSNINERMQKACSFLRSANFLFITFGTAWVFESIKTGQIVSNCHKIPAKEFVRYRLSIDDIVSMYKELIWKLNVTIPDLHIIFTVSPIRHWKDGAHENTISKSVLHLTIEALQQEFTNISYFPAYEILIDELRDYRFYAEDMIHPSSQAVNYIWKKFAETYFSEETQNLIKEVDKLNGYKKHKPFYPNSQTYDNFIAKTQQEKERLIKQYPFLADRIQI